MAQPSSAAREDGSSAIESRTGRGISLLEQLSKATGLAAALAFVLSVIYDWAYLDAIGLSFAMVPTSISDHVRTSLIWLPATGLFFLASTVIGFLTGRATRVAFDRQQKGTSPARALKFATLFWGVAFFIAFVAFGGTPAMFYLSLAMVVMPTMMFVSDWLRRGEPATARDGLLVLIPTVVVLVAAWGAIRAGADQTASRPISAFRDSGSTKGTVRVRPIRHFERAVLAVNESGSVKILRPDDLLSVEDLPRPYHYSGGLCMLFGVRCYQAPRALGPKQ